jgi:hypothetical protein
MFDFVHLYNGQEAVSTGFIKLLNQADCVVSTYRDHVHVLSKGIPARSVMAELLGKATGCCCGQGGSMHMFSAPHNLLGGFFFFAKTSSEALPSLERAFLLPQVQPLLLSTALMAHWHSLEMVPVTMASSLSA